VDRTKQPKLVITFPTTTAAMAMEAACQAGQGRLIPIPREINGGCGLAWCAEPQLGDMLLQVMAENNISYQEKRIISLY